MASNKKRDLNGYDNHAYSDASEIGMKRMSTSEGKLNGKQHFEEEEPDYMDVTSSTLKKQNNVRSKIVIMLLILVVAGIVALGVSLHFLAGDNSPNRFEDFMTTTTKSASTAKMTTPKDKVSIVDLGVNITLVDLDYSDDLANESTEAYKNFTNVIVSAVDFTYKDDQYYGGVTVISLSPGSIKVELTLSFNMPVDETERSNAIETTVDNIIPNMESAMNRTSSNSLVEVITPLCDIEPCSNGGTCSETENSSDYSCDCENGFTGKSCQIDTDECESSPCANGGECINQEGSYSCTCAPGYIGTNCEEDIDDCAEVTCENGGTCEDLVNDFTCQCKPGFQGETCEIDVNECERSPCENGGTCTDVDGSYECTCAAGFTGINCEQDVTTDVCGTRPAYSPVSSRIIGGSPTQLGDWPWMVSLRDRFNVHRCAAVVISNTTAITAAHCLKKFDIAVLGDLKLSTTSPYHLKTDVESVIHPDYDRDNINNDIALINFDFDLIFNDYIRPICFEDQDVTNNFDACYVTGWGHTSEGGSVSDTLMEAQVELFDHDQCQAFYPDHDITSNMICAGDSEGNKDSCQGDTGGPLQCEDQNGRFHLIGITSFGIGCGKANKPGVYTDVSKYLEFINSTKPDLEPATPAIEVYLNSPAQITLQRTAFIDMSWIFNTPDGNALDIYIFTYDVLPVVDTLLIGTGSDPDDMSTVIANTGDFPAAHVYRVFSKAAWMKLTTAVLFVYLPGIRVLVEAVIEEDTTTFCADRPCGAENICMENSVGYSCNCLDITNGSSCKELSHDFGGGESYSYLDRHVKISTAVECDFDDGWCGWDKIPRPETQFEWNLHDTSTELTFYGPSTDHTYSGSGNYIYANMYDTEEGETTSLASSKFFMTDDSQSQCFSFYYYMVGKEVADLDIYFVAEADNTLGSLVWSSPGKIENRWSLGQFKLNVSGWFIIDATSKGHSRGSISIDEIQFTDCLYNDNIREDLTLSPGEIIYMASPNFPNPYPNRVTQLWTITAPVGYGARFDLDVITLEPSFDRLSIGTGHDPTDEASILESWTGEHVLQSVIRASLQFQYWVFFESDLTVVDRGFVIAIYAVEFTEYFITMETGETMNITSMNYPMEYTKSQIILWLLTAPPQHGFYFRFVTFDTEGDRDKVIVGSGASPSADEGIQLAELSGSITPSDIASDVNQTWILFRPDYESTATSGFFVEIRTVERPDCAESNVFRCPNGQCIPLKYACDGYNDCQDFTDEEHCPTCLEVPANCSALLPYNVTYFPNKHASSAAEAGNILQKVIYGCPNGNSIMQLACNMLYPECPHFGPTRQACYSNCVTESDVCIPLYEGMYGETWPLRCDSLPEDGQDMFGICNGPNNNLLNTSTCGTRPAYKPYQSRIVGGVKAQEGEFPWMAYLYNSEAGQYCGATLISPEWVMTAAHCVWGTPHLLDAVVMGDLLLSDHSEHHLAIPPAQIIVHPMYNSSTYERDIALIRLSEPVLISDYVNPACLSETFEEIKDYKTCIITGWGNTEQDDADNLRKAVVRLIEEQRCKQLYGIPDGFETDVFICAGNERGGIDTCQGDSGGPMVCEGSDGRWHLTGVTSFGYGCADPGFPGIYARVSTLLPFIESVVLGDGTEAIMLQHGEQLEITSPNYPGYYSDNVDKTWYIVAPPGYGVAIDFPYFELEHSFDFLIIYDGVTGVVDDRQLIHRLTGNETIGRIKTFGSHVWIRFTTDVSIQYRGFRIILSTTESMDCDTDDVFKCPNRRCILPNATCDGYNDCGDFSDEDYCPPCEDVPQICMNTVPYNSTYFPNPNADYSVDAQEKVEALFSIGNCHNDMMRLACSTFFPECIHYGPTRRPCLSDCMAVTDACQDLYQAVLEQPWPINCTFLTDSQREIDGSCSGPEGDYLNTTICGTRPAYTPDHSRVVGGVDAKEGEFPWMVYLYDDLRGQFCGGTLVGPEWVATAAHCVDGDPFSTDRIILGDLLLSSESNHHLSITPAEIIPYPYYDAPAHDGDFALIKLSQPVNFTEFVRPTCLAESSEETRDYTRCFVSGWGNMETGFDADVLQKAIVHLIPSKRCAELYEGRTSDLMICAGYERGGIDTCQGDSGGPLVCEGSDGRWHLVGATSWGYGCADPGFPGIYARVSQFLQFINQVFAGNYTASIPTPTVPSNSSTPSPTDTPVTVIMMSPGMTEQILSPNFPNNYGANTDVTWYIIAPSGYDVVINFVSFRLENGYDYLTIYEGITSNMSQRVQSYTFTGYQIPNQITTFGSYAWLWFTSDNIIHDKGFNITLSVVEAKDCNGTDEFSCANGRCILSNATCDGYNDCLDFSDEDYCPPCVETPEPCRGVGPHNLTYFPNPNSKNIEDALKMVQTIAGESVLVNCHSDMMRLACSTFFPECIHYGPTRRPCLSDCMAVTDACQELYQAVLEKPWPINCTFLTDSQREIDGSCSGPEGDYLNTTICGTRPAYTPDHSRVVGGIDAKEGEFPWMVYLYSLDWGQVCGGTLIGSEWVATAAHCVVNVPFTVDRIVLGDLLLSSASNHHLSITPAEIIPYPYYDAPAHDGDLALIKLSQPVNFTEFVRPACLAESSEEIRDYTRCFVSGWGNTESGFDPDVLQKAIVHLISSERCAELYVNSTSNLMICAGYERGGIDTCQGDSGGPLVCEGSDGRWHLVGATSWGYGCADPGFPGIYARVSQFLHFINQVFAGNYTASMPTPTVPSNSSTPSPTDEPVTVITLEPGMTEQILSPNFPNSYSANTDVTWHIIAPSGYDVVINFVSFRLEDRYDYLTIYEGITSDMSQRVQSYRLTGYQIPNQITTFGSYAWLWFTSDSSVQDEGFNIILSVVETIDCNVTSLFSCANGRCIPSNATCDGFNDCLDFSDEDYCHCDADDAFICANGRCILSNATCDGFNDCRDFSDEDYCPPCLEMPQPCRGILPHNLTYFPNPNTDNIEDALIRIQAITGESQLISCHSDMMELACSTFFPECIHYGPTRRPCLSDCMAVTDACQELYQAVLEQPWPINCTFLTDSQREIDGSCSGPEGDYLNTTICGTRPAYIPDHSRVVGGVDAKEGEFPWMVYLYSLDWGQVCGGTLIGSEWVATAAHCVVDVPFTVDRIILGDLLLSSASNHHLSITPAEIIPYPYYNHGVRYHGDFALIKLSQPVNFTDFVRPACLAESSEETKDYTRCFVSGWGNMETSFDADLLQKAIVQLIPSQRCAELYVNLTSDLMICAGYERGGIDTCQGDSGGPLVCEGSDGRWHLVGATSWGYGCADPGFPGIYARVSQFLQFINQVFTGNYTAPISTSLPTMPTDTPVTVITMSPGMSEQVLSPNFPNNYSANTDMTWLIFAPSGYSVVINFESFRLEDGWDHLYIYYEEESDMFRHDLTGSTIPNQITTFSSIVNLRFKSDSVGQDQGFNITLSLILTTDLTTSIPFFTSSTPNTDREINLDVGQMVEITSPNFPDDYPNNVYITWFVRAPINYNAVVRISEFLTERNYDFLTLYGGTSPVSADRTSLATLSGDQDIDEDIFSSGSYMWLDFSSDSSVTSRGFRLVLISAEATELANCSSGKIIYRTSLCDGFFDCPSGVDELDCPPIQLEAGESTIITSQENPNFMINTTFEWAVTSVDANLALVVKVDYVTLSLGDVISIRTVGADSGEDHVWILEGPVSLDYSQTADKVFPSGDLDIQAYTLNGTRPFRIEVLPALLKDISGCAGNDKLITPQYICDGIVDCPDFSDEQNCVPLATISLNIGQMATIETPGYPDYIRTTSPLRMMWTVQSARGTRIRFDVTRFVMEASHTITIGTGLDPLDDSSIVFQVNGLPLADDSGTVVGDISPQGNSMWLRLDKELTSAPSSLVLSANVEAVTEESLQCPSDQHSCGGVFPGCYDDASSCDGVNDCFDGSDEDCDCPYILDVRCGPLNTCIHRRVFCDGRVDCGDDESTCTFVCDNGRIVSDRFICDGYNDCGDYTDELQDCECASNQYDCGERCISMNDVCNDYVDCANGADEANCACKSFEFQCDNGGCVPFWTLCNGVDDCGDGSEEIEATCRYCPENYFQCKDFSFCRSSSSVCNGFIECTDGSDEWGCGGEIIDPVPTLEPTRESPSPTASETPPFSFTPYADCGQRPALDVHRVTHGEDVAVLGEWPWQIALYVDTAFYCGGSVISPEWILTAAHCVDVPGLNYSIKAGSLDPVKYEGGGQIRDVSFVFVHPLYYQEGVLSNDIALLKLASPLEINDDVQPVCLPSNDEQIPQPGFYVTFTGWGSYTERYSPQPDLLQEARMPVAPNDFCDHYIQGIDVLPSMFCIMYPNGYQGLCTGDSGGPIVQEIDDRWTIVGVTSWGQICGVGYIPNGLTRVSSFLDVIRDVMNLN